MSVRWSDDVFVRNVYGSAPGETLGTTSSADSSGRGSGAPVAAEAARESAANAGIGGNPLATWAALIVLLLGLFYLATRVGSSDDFANLKASAYNVLVVGLIAIVAIPPIKLAVSMLPVPAAVKQYVLAV